MQLKRELWISIGVLVALDILVSFGSVGLLSRMSPAIEQILLENVVSTEAAETMIGVLARATGRPAPEEERSLYDQALQQALDNVTEEEERPVLEGLAADRDAALEGDPVAVGRSVAGAQELVAVNRRAMGEVDLAARRLGTAGAWAAVILGILALLVTVIVVRRLQRRILSPLADLHDTLEAARGGDHQRRCRPADVPAEIQAIIRSVNALLDARMERTLSADEDDRVARAAVRALLDRQPDAMVVLAPGGRIIASSAAAEELLRGDRGPRLRHEAERAANRGAPKQAEDEPSSLQSIGLDDGFLWILPEAQ